MTRKNADTWTEPTRRGKSIRTGIPIEVIPEDMNAASFVYDALAEMGISTAKFDADAQQTYELMIGLTKRAEAKGFEVVTKPAGRGRDTTQVYVRAKRRFNVAPTQCPKCGKSKYFCECGARRRNSDTEIQHGMTVTDTGDDDRTLYRVLQVSGRKAIVARIKRDGSLGIPTEVNIGRLMQVL